MGRRPKYLTLEAKRLAQSEHQRKYRASAKAKETKTHSNRAYYEARKDAGPALEPPSSLSLRDVPLPLELQVRGAKIFRAAFAAYDSVPTLGLWDSPYRFDAPPRETMKRYSASEDVEGPDEDIDVPEGLGAVLWRSYGAVLGSAQCERIMDAGYARAKRWQSMPPAAIDAEVRVELAVRIDGWMELFGLGEELEDPEAREVALDWGAKIVLLLIEEGEYRLREGVKAYSQGFRENRLPWQAMMVEIRRLLDDEN